MAPRPNLFLVGAMKSGSSSLTHYLHAHPQVYMTMRPKEPSYFVDRETLREVYPAMEKLGFWRGEDEYLKLFTDAGDAPIVGDASQNYARLPRVPGVVDRIQRFDPGARILYIMRDPVERCISHYWYMVRFFGERRSMMKALTTDPDYLSTSDYAMQLEPFRESFGTERVLAVTSEELRQDPVRVLRAVYGWLGVDPGFRPPDVEIQANRTPPTVEQPRGLGLLHAFRYSRFWEALGPRVPSSLRRFARHVSSQRTQRSNVSTTEVEAQLRPLLQPQVEQLSEMLGREFPLWTTTCDQTE